MKKTILFIEDDAATLDVYGTALRDAQFEVETMSWGQQALDRIKEIQEGRASKPDLVLLDLILPDINGILVLGEMRKHAETKDIAVFVFTNHTGKELEQKARELQSEKFLLKTDYPPTKLVGLIKTRIK